MRIITRTPLSFSTFLPDSELGGTSCHAFLRVGKGFSVWHLLAAAHGFVGFAVSVVPVFVSVSSCMFFSTSSGGLAQVDFAPVHTMGFTMHTIGSNAWFLCALEFKGFPFSLCEIVGCLGKKLCDMFMEVSRIWEGRNRGKQARPLRVSMDGPGTRDDHKILSSSSMQTIAMVDESIRG